MAKSMQHGVVLLSGGMDSTTLAYWMREQAKVTAVSIYYGQRHHREMKYAERTARKIGAEWYTVDLSQWGVLAASVLTQDGDVPEGHYAEDNMVQTVVPFRNPIMLSVATSIASSVKADVVAGAMHAGDHFVYPDCRPAFVDAFAAMSDLALEGLHAPVFETPFIDATKADIAKEGHRLHVPWEDTWSCYKGEREHCGRCGTCVERAEAFAIAGVPDPTDYLDPDYWKEATGWETNEAPQTD